MPPHVSSSETPRSSASPSAATPTGSRLRSGQDRSPPGSPCALKPLERRLARYLYVASLVRGRRVLDIGCGEGRGAAFLVERGAQSVIGLDVIPGGSTGPAERTPAAGVTVRPLTVAELLRPEGMRLAAGHGTYEVIFLHGTPELINQPFLGELRRMLARDGHLVVAVRSKETFATAADAVAYFDLLDSLSTAGFGPVAMLGQSPFLGAAVVPFGASDPPLVFDDTLAPPEVPDEYIAVCGPPPPRALPYQVVKLPHTALESVSIPERVVERVEVPVHVDSPALVSERDALKGRVEALGIELEKRQQEAQVARAGQRGIEERLHALDSENATHKAELRVLIDRLEEATAAKRTAEAQLGELRERLHQRDRSDSEATQAALLHERQMRELRVALEEREAFVAELEEQARELPRLQEQLHAAQKIADESARSERLARQKLAEVEGLLLRARGEINARAAQTQLAVELEGRQRELEAQRRELLVQRDEIEQAERRHAERQAIVEQTAEQLARERAELERLRGERQNSERAIAQRDAALGEARQELVSAQDRLQLLHAELEQKTRALSEATARLERSRSERGESWPGGEGRPQVLTAPSLGAARPVESDGVPLLVGDMPTAPIGGPGGPGEPAPQEELAQLRHRIAELSAENDRLKDKITEAERETWKHLKARSEAEQAAAEVREDTVRKLRDARKLASVELTRAMEDATKKAVQLREELARTEAERKEALQQIKELRTGRDAAVEQATALKQELDTLRWSAALPESGSAARPSESQVSDELQRARTALSEERSARQTAQQAADEAQSRIAELRGAVVALEQALAEARQRTDNELRHVEALEEELRHASGGARSEGVTGEVLRLQQELQGQVRLIAERTAERDALARLLSEVEREAAARAERARAMRVRLSEREREVETLRSELYDRERKIAALEQQSPPSEEVARLEADLQATRRRITDLLEETARTEHHGDDAVATALRERARAVRMTEALDQTTRERDEARSRTGELEQRLNEAVAESDRLRGELLRASSGTPSTLSNMSNPGLASSASAQSLPRRPLTPPSGETSPSAHSIEIDIIPPNRDS